MASQSTASISTAEVSRFSEQSAEWWKPDGAFEPLHRLNPVRLTYVRDQVCQHFGLNNKPKQPLRGLQILDVGCGGGLLTEPLTRMGAIVRGLDASDAAIAEAKRHAAVMNLDIDYCCSSAEDMAQQKQRYDVITALEIAEHVADMDSFIASVAKLLKPNGKLVLSTLNRTAKSFMLGIIAAEYILQWVPRRTHSWKKFIRPSELARRCAQHGLQATNIMGMGFNPMSQQFELRQNDVGVNYLMTAIK
jgi:2-polyprenyl-6-hydroxyphenyl methylase/3-demethylubiquinone-9 3-methyltransferase